MASCDPIYVFLVFFILLVLYIIWTRSKCQVEGYAYTDCLQDCQEAFATTSSKDPNRLKGYAKCRENCKKWIGAGEEPPEKIWGRGPWRTYFAQAHPYLPDVSGPGHVSHSSGTKMGPRPGWVPPPGWTNVPGKVKPK